MIDPSSVPTDDKLLIAFGIYMAKEVWKLMKDATRKNSKEIGKQAIQIAKIQQDISSAWTRIRNLEKR